MSTQKSKVMGFKGPDPVRNNTLIINVILELVHSIEIGRACSQNRGR